MICVNSYPFIFVGGDYMPVFALKDQEDGMEIRTSGSLSYSAAKIEVLKNLASEFVLCDLVGDRSGSLVGFEEELERCQAIAIAGCEQSPQADNLLIRVTEFSTAFSDGVKEVHGYKSIRQIFRRTEQDTDDTVYAAIKAEYPSIVCGGATPLYQALYSSVRAMLDYAKVLRSNGFSVNGVIFVMTDGKETENTISREELKKYIQAAMQGEGLLTLTIVVIGMNITDPESEKWLKLLVGEVGITHYQDGGSLTMHSAAKMGQFITQTITTVSIQLQSGQPAIQPVIAPLKF
jgi:hypothetical protein